MDAVSELLDGHRARGAFLLRCVMEPPWSVLIDDRSTVSVVVMVRGGLALTRDGDEPVRLVPGDVAVIKGTAPYVVADEAGRAPEVVIGPGQECRSVDGADLQTAYRLGLRSWGNAADGSCAFLTGTY